MKMIHKAGNRKRIAGILLAAAVLWQQIPAEYAAVWAAQTDDGTPAPQAEETVYLDAAVDENTHKVTFEQKTAQDCTAVTADDTSWGAADGGQRWYAADGAVTCNSGVSVTGSVCLILKDGCELKVPWIEVQDGGSLSVYAQSEDKDTMGCLKTDASAEGAKAGIGTINNGNGEIAIYGGHVVSKSGRGAGIGIGLNGRGRITIYGGYVNAEGGFSSTGISSGVNGEIVIYGGAITATGGADTAYTAGGAGIGSGVVRTSGRITIYDGIITALGGEGTEKDKKYGGAGIGKGGYWGNLNEEIPADSIQINGGTVTAVGGEGAAGIGGVTYDSGGGDSISGIQIRGGLIKATGGEGAAGIGGGYKVSASDIQITGGVVYAESQDAEAVGSGADAGEASSGIVKENAVIFENKEGLVWGSAVLQHDLDISGDCSLIIRADAKLSGLEGVRITGGSSLVSCRVTQDMIRVPEQLVYTGTNQTEAAKEAVTVPALVPVCGADFAVDTSGWEKSISRTVQDAGTYQAVYTNADNSSLTVSKDFSVARAAVTVQADDKTAVQGSAVPELTYSVSGIAAGEQLAVQPRLECHADMNSPGSYPVTASGAAVPDGNNYIEEITYRNGTLTVTEKNTSGSGSTPGGGTDSGSTPGGGTGSGSTPGSGTGSGSTPGGISGSGTLGGSTSGGGTGGTGTQAVKPSSGQPYIRDSAGKSGWTVIKAEADRTEAGGTVSVDMNGAEEVPADVFERIKGKDITLVFDAGGGIQWHISGKDITAQNVSGMNLSVKKVSGEIPAEAVRAVSGGADYYEIRLAHNGAFGMRARLCICLDAKYSGYQAKLYYYNPQQHALEFVSEGKAEADGTVLLDIYHASDYVMILSGQDGGIQKEPYNPLPVQELSVKLDKTVFTYSGKEKRPGVTVYAADGSTVSDEHYDVSYAFNLYCGRGRVTVQMKGAFSGTIEKEIKIRPAKTYIRQLIPKKNGFTVKAAEKKAQTSGYQIQYSADKNFASGSIRNVWIKSQSSGAQGEEVQKTVRSLKAGEKYFVRVRTYKNIPAKRAGGKSRRYYSIWSAAKQVTV